MIKGFREVTEARGDTAVFTFGRFNPPTTGHEKLIEAVAKQHKRNAGSKMYVYPSHSQDAKKNPLPHTKKIAYMRKMFPKYKRNIIVAKPRTAIEVAVELYKKGHKALVMVVGSDRVQEFQKLLDEYNGVESRHGYYGFDNIEVISAGERDPDAEGVEGMSASKMRAAAGKGDYDSFKLGLPKSFKDGKSLYRDVRAQMGIREERDMGEMDDLESMRDAYLTGKLWNIGETVIVNGVEGEVVMKGTNYLSFVDESGKVHKAWLHEIELDESKAPDVKKGDVIIVSKSKRPYKMGGMVDPKTTLPAESDKMVVKKVTKSKDGRKAHLTHHDPKKRGGYAIYLDKMPDFMSVKIAEEVELDERNYRKEYDNYQGKPEQIARRSSRNKARRIMGDKTKIGMDVGHKDNNPLNNDPSNLRNEVPSDNRREPRLRDEKYDSDKFFGGKGTPEQRTQLLKLQNKALRALGGSPKQKEIKKEIDALRKKMGMKVSEEVNERLVDQFPWLRKALSTLHRLEHPKGYEKIIQRYVDGMKDPEHRAHPSAWAGDIARQYRGVDGRDLISYINKLVDKGKLPKELKAEVQKENFTFKELVEKINKNGK